ncbi:MAG: shikimate dehydrogenase [Actinobacteria bacterium]|nr:shikimate dehydrogenase [Actinomycetota bacterium]MCA1719923.1 shikimate dehydrogenase [Actinomycetota bacterium]
MRAAVLGSPIGHSLSPALHRAAYAELGLDWTYDAIEVTAPDLPAFLAGLDGTWAGLSLTMPLKQAVLPLLGSRSSLVDEVGAANTVLLPARHGENTDVGGIVDALAAVGVQSVSRAVVLGGGATARSALAALRLLGCLDPVAVVRTPRDLPSRQVTWSPDVLADCELLISTLPAGAADAFAPYVRDVPVLLDVVYDPWPTAIASACRGLVVPGSAMLLHQAAAQVSLMTGRKPPLAAMAAALKHSA